MLEKILPAIKDPADYLAALALFSSPPLAGAEAEKLLAVYAKYLRTAEDPAYLKVCMAADLLPGREREAAVDLAPLDLGDATLDALFAAKKIASGRDELTAHRAQEIVAMAEDEEAAVGARVLLARLALDTMTTSLDFADLREQVAALAAFLTGCGAEVLDRYTPLVGEVRAKCRG